MSDYCHFCSEAFQNDKGPLDSDGPLFIARYDTHPVGFGHTLIVPTRHVAKFAELSPEETQALGGVVQSVISTFIASVPESLLQFYEDNLAQKPTPKAEEFSSRMLELDYADTAPVDFTHGINDGPLAGQTIGHLHYHVIPRYKGDVDNPAFGVRNVFPQDLANYK